MTVKYYQHYYMIKEINFSLPFSPNRRSSLYLELTLQSQGFVYGIIQLSQLLMFRREREFNIISGETLAFPCSRSASNIEKVRKFDSLGQLAAKPIERLGYSKDRKQFQYSYASNPVSLKLATEFTSHEQLKQHPSMLNSVSTDYNIVTMRAQHPTSKVVSSQMFAQKLPQVNRRSPLTEHMDAGRLFATNYHEDYPERTANREFFRRKNLCDQTCDNEKTYGFKYFRPLK